MFFLWSSWIVSCSTTTPSRIWWPGMKAVWVGRITFGAIPVILFVPTFVNILKLTFSRQIGWHCCILTASSFFGKRIINPKFNLYSDNYFCCNILKSAIKPFSPPLRDLKLGKLVLPPSRIAPPCSPLPQTAIHLPLWQICWRNHDTLFSTNKLCINFLQVIQLAAHWIYYGPTFSRWILGILWLLDTTGY
jgi:hypothetical protein